MTYEQFVAQNGQPRPPTASTRAGATAPTPQISTAAIQAELAAGPQAAPATDSSFTAALVGQLQAAFLATGPWPENLSATISFELSADGRLRTIKMVDSSKLPAFDAAAQNACRQTRLESVPPSAIGKPYKITFRSEPRR